MITWEKIKDDTWVIRGKNKVFTVDNIQSLFAYNIALGINFNEIEFALLEATKNGHDIVEFGIFNTFTISKKLGEFHNETIH